MHVTTARLERRRACACVLPVRMRGNHATENNQNFVAVASRNVVALPKFAKMRVAVVCVLLSLAALAYSQRPQPCSEYDDAVCQFS